MLRAEQIRAARAMLRWDQSTLAEAAKVSVESIKRLERLDGPVLTGRAATIHAIEKALTDAGIEFTNGEAPGVRLHPKR
jgi:transcriptional regulator with XRE-family HTH domain